MPFEFGGSSAPSKDTSTNAGSSSFSGGQLTKSGGFSNKPTVGNGEGNSLSNWSPTGTFDGFRSSGATGTRTNSSPRASRGSGFSLPDIPWGVILTALAVVAVLVFIWFNRALITAFIQQLFSWVIMILIIVLIFKFIFRRR